MRTRFRKWDTETNNQAILPEGMVTINTDDYSLRIHDGVTLGGFEIKTKSVVNWGPGPRTVIGGDGDSGFLGEMTDAELISGQDLALAVGLSVGVAVNDGSGWLKFTHQGKILYIAKKPIRKSISWDYLYQAGLVYGVDGPGLFPGTDGVAVNQEVVVPIGADHLMKVRLLTGGDVNPMSTAGGEWNDIFYPICNNDPEGRFWAMYTESDLGLTTGGHQWVQETDAVNNTYAFIRGGGQLTRILSVSKDLKASNMSWRPVLELVP